MMQKWVEYVCRAAGDSCIWSTGHHYGDWLALDAGEGNYTGASRKEFIATAFYAHSAQLLAQAMDALGYGRALHIIGCLKRSVPHTRTHSRTPERDRMCIGAAFWSCGGS